MERKGPQFVRTHVVQSTVRIAVGDDLDSGVDALGNTGDRAQVQILHTESTKSFLAERLLDNDTEVAAGLVAQSQEDFDGGFIVTHGQGDGEGRHGDGGTVRRDGILTTAGECAEGVFIEATGRREVELEVSLNGDRQQSQESGRLGEHVGNGCVRDGVSWEMVARWMDGWFGVERSDFGRQEEMVVRV